MTFSPASLRTVSEFATRLGLPARPAQDGSFSFVFTKTGTLSLTATRDGRRIYVSLARKPQRIDADLLMRILSRAGFDPTTNRLLHAGLAPDDSVHVAVDLAEPEFDLTSLDASLRQLADLLDGLE